MKDKSHLTAIARRTLPTPVRWLMRRAYVVDHRYVPTLDFGCGRCASVNPKSWDSYDPYYAPKGIPRGKKYLIILCTYVLCAITPTEREKVLKRIRSLLTPHGIAFITVRNDRPAQGWGCSSKGTYQGRVKKLALPLLYQNSQFRIHMLTRSNFKPTITAI